MAHPQGRARPECRRREKTPVYVWGEARNAAGRTVTARVRVPNGYTVTTDAAVAIARRLLEGAVTAGFHDAGAADGRRFRHQAAGSDEDHR